MFQTAVTRLTLWYLLLAMFLAAIFSFALYAVSTQELNRLEYRQQSQQTLLYTSPLSAADRDTLQEFLNERLQETENSKHAIAINLLYFNLLVLALGGAASYILARRTLQPIEEGVEAQKRFTSDASHELRTPLTAMKSEIEVALRDRHLSALEARKLLKSNLEEVAKLESLSDGLLKLARQDLTLGTVETLELGSLINEACTRVKPLANARHIEIRQDVPNISIEGERWGLVELVTILLDNALKYSHPKTTITIHAEVFNKSVLVSVADEGIGIHSDDLPHIFERFYRADQSRTKTAVGGYGLGLSIAQRIARIHSGDLTVVSTQGKGSIFTAKLPLHQGKPKKKD